MPAPALTSRETVLYALLSPLTRANTVARARAVRQRLDWDRPRLEALRLHRCRAVLEAAARTPYWAEAFRDRGFSPGALTEVRGVAALPPLQRQALRDRFDDLRDPTRRPGELRPVSTGGTTGQPVRVLVDRSQDLERMLVTHRMYALMGRPLGARTLWIAGSPIDAQALQSLGARVKNLLFRVDVRNSFRLSTATRDAIIEELARGGHDLVVAYASVFDILCGELEARGRRLRVGRISPAAELVTEAQRERWRLTLGAEVFEIYGSRELNSIAGEVPDHEGLLVNEDIYHVEVTDDAGRPLPDGEPGLITITDLIDRGMPLVRYQLGDVGVLAPPGPSWPAFRRMRVTHGRVLDVIRCPDGTMLPGEFFPHLVKEVAPEVERFQAVQTDVDRVVLRIVPTARFRPETAGYLERHVNDRLGRGMRVSVEIVPAIELSPSGKYRPTRNLVEGPDAGASTRH